MHRPSRDRLLSAVVGAVFLLASSTAGQAQTTRLIPLRRALPTGPTVAGARSRLPQGRRPHLQLARPAGLRSRPGLRRAGPQRGPALPDTLHILVLRLQFQPDEDPLTTGDGSFDLRDVETFRAQEGHDIDAAPHDRSYVSRHMRALRNYWWAMSEGALNLEADVYPYDAHEVYNLPRTMAYYGFETPLGDLAEAFKALVTDAVAAALGGADPIDWDRYDAFVLFHAGADWQGDIAGSRDTPADLPTAYVVLDHPVMAGTRAIRDATIIPETVSQDAFVGGINGSFAHEFGHQLGLPDLYDTVGGATAVGLFALMDSGGESGGTVEELFVWGVLPAAISAWSRSYMDWTTPVEVGPGQSVDLIASTALAGIHDPPPGAKVALIGAGGGQAFLVEFRSDDLDGDPSVSLFWEEGVIDGTGAMVGGVKTRTYEYDALLPASGVLIWHLDEEVAGRDPDGNGFTNFEDNTLQQDRLRRFLDVEEADGLQEIGWFPGYVGTDGDFWQPAPAGPNRFGPFSRPSTASWTGARTGLDLEVLPHASSLAKRLSVRLQAGLGGWAAPLPEADPEISIPWMVDPEGSGTQVVAVLDGVGGLHLFNTDGTAAVGNNPVWTAPVPPRAALTHVQQSFLVAAGDSLFFLREDGVETAAVDLGAPAVRRPIGYYEWGAGRSKALVEVEGARVLDVSAGGIEEEWELEKASSALIYNPALGCMAAVGKRLIRMDPSSGGETEVIWEAGDELIDAVQFQYPGSGSLTPFFVAVLDRADRLSLLDPSRGLFEAAVYATVSLPRMTGRLAVAYLKEDRVPTVLVPTVEGIRAVEATGPPTSGWPPAPRGRAAVEPPYVLGTPLTLAYGVVVGLTDASELVVYGPNAQLLPGGLNQLLWQPISPITLGLENSGEEPCLLFADSDSLRVISLGLSRHLWLSPVWSGPSGGADGCGMAAEPAVIDPSDVQVPLIDFYVYPNPARDRCRIRVEGFAGTLLVRAYTQAGTYLGEVDMGEVARLSDVMGRGAYEAEWDVSRLAPGVYFLVAEVESPAGVHGRYKHTVLVVR